MKTDTPQTIGDVPDAFALCNAVRIDPARTLAFTASKVPATVISRSARHRASTASPAS